ncbi:MAG: universal stress protein, partial [Novipirellula sp. JB048]
TDLSSYSEATIRTTKALGLLDRLSVSLLHVFSVPATALMRRVSLSDAEKQSYIAGEKRRVAEEVASFVNKINVDGVATILKPATASIDDTICETASEMAAELIVMGTCGRSIVARVLMGSVTEGVLRNSDRDVLAIPPP